MTAGYSTVARFAVREANAAMYRRSEIHGMGLFLGAACMAIVLLLVHGIWSSVADRAADHVHDAQSPVR